VDGFEIAGGGIIADSLSDDISKLQKQVITRNLKWIKSDISREKRAARYKQRPTLVVISGSRDSGKKPLARELEKMLFQSGELVYFMGIGSVVYGVDADIKSMDNKNREEHLRRVGEIINIMLDAGMILILTAIDLSSRDMEIIKTVADPPALISVWSGDEEMTDFSYDMKFVGDEYTVNACEILNEMKQRGIIFGGIY
jgi:bifunctional enzyme CysN/CysC